MVLLKYLLTDCGLKQGDWIDTGDYKGIYISSISPFSSVIATYNDRNQKYVNVRSKDMKKIDRVVDGKLFEFARRHILWSQRIKKNEIST